MCSSDLWQRDMSRYQAQLDYSLLGRRRSQSSEGRIGALALMPERFVDHKGKDLTVVFAQAGGEATLPNGEQVSLQAGAQDRLSIILNLSALVASHPQAFSPGHRLTQQAVGAGGVTVWTWTHRGIEELTLPGGTLTAQRWVREARESGDQGLEVWISQTLGYLPARIRITKSNGDQIDQQWHRHQALANP